jgi:hypothetical protein
MPSEQESCRMKRPIVQSVKPGDSVTLNMTKEQAEAQGATKPDFLDQLT